MKIIQLVESAGAGVGRHVVDLTNGLLDRGHAVDLLYSDLRCDSVFREDLRRLTERSSFRSWRLRMRRGLHPGDLLAVRSLRQYVCGHGPFDVVHSHSTKAGLIGRIGLTGLTVNRLYSPHGFFSSDPSLSTAGKRVASEMERVLAGFCDGVVVVSRQERQLASIAGIPDVKVSLVRHGVSPLDRYKDSIARTELRRKWGIGEHEICIGFAGRLVPVKAPETILRAFGRLVARNPDHARLVIVGNGPLAATCRQLSTRLGIDARTVWLDECDAKRCMHAFDIFAFTSVAEAAGLVVLEALTAGLPVVATPVGIVPEAVHPGVNGFIAPVGGVEEIASALEVLVNNPALRERMGQASLAISRDFSVDRMVDQTIAVYEQVIAGTLNRPEAQGKEAAAAR